MNNRLLHALLLLPLLCFLRTDLLQAQTFEEGLQLYENEQYEEALAIFRELPTPEATLFTGKSYYSMGEYLRAKSHLDRLPGNTSAQIANESRFTSALIAFQLDQFGPALQALYSLREIRPRTPLINQSITLYNGILDYLTLAQRRRAFQFVGAPEIRTDLIRSAFGKVDYRTARLLLHELETTLGPEYAGEINGLKEMLQDSLSYTYRKSYENRLRAPRGIVYDIGAALPKFDPGSAEMSVSRGLFQGYLLAAEDFNQRNADKKAFIRYQNTGANMDSAAYAMNHLAWSNNVDAVLGPLFSEPAMRIADLAERYQIPVLAPLANSDSLNIDNPFVFQANPTFGSHGKKMAEYAVTQLGMDTLAVFAEKNSLGEISAYAFRNEAERLGAHIKHFMIEDLESEGYDISTFSRRLAPDTITTQQPEVPPITVDDNRDRAIPDTLLRNSLDGVYAPFTGQAASTLIDLLMIDLQVMDSRLTVLGSQEWGATTIPEERLKGRPIYFSESFYIDSKSERVEQFRDSYQQRFGTEPNRYAMIGYDSADYLLRVLETVENPDLLKDAIKTYPRYEGLISNIRFDGTHVNQEVKVFRISPQGIRPAMQ